MNKIDWDKVEADLEQNSHYYGDLVRKFLLAGAIIMLVTLPILREYISVPLTLSLLAILVIGIAAGLTSPKQLWAVLFNIIIAGGAVLVFEYFAVDAYARYGLQSLLFITDQVLALNFLVALYYGVKTARGMWLNLT